MLTRVTACWVMLVILTGSRALAQKTEAPGLSSTSRVASKLLVKEASHRSSAFGWKSQFQIELFTVFSTAEESQVRPVVERLTNLRREIEEELGLSLPTSEIRMVVLQDRDEYDAYLATHFPQLPKRRALFIQHRGPGLILTYLHRDWHTDARHECTHAFLHESYTKLPSWLDEGLAEYFENESVDRTQHPEHRQAVTAQLRFGQVPTIDELEQWNLADSLEAKQYRDAWSTVVFLLHHNEASRNAMKQYLADLQSGAAAGYLGRRLDRQERLEWRENFLKFYSSK